MSINDSSGSAAPMAPAPGPTGPAGGPPARTTSGMAIASLVLGIAGFLVVTIPVNLVLGILALTRTGRRGQKGKGLVVAGLTLSAAWAVGLGVLGAIAISSPEPERDAQGQITKPAQAAPDKLKVGDCVAQINTAEVSDVRAQPCGQPGGGKVFAVFQLPQRSWPGEKVADDKAGGDCVKRYERSRQQAAEESEIQYLRPTEASWRLGDRRVVCLLYPKA
jgi:hypothetical protein